MNGVLRSFVRQLPSLLVRAEADPVACHRHPAWWIRRVRADFPDDWQAILAAGNLHPPMSLRQNRRVAGDLDQALAEAEIGWHAVDDLPVEVEAFCLNRPLPVERLPGFADGLCSVQDAGAQCAAWLLDLADGQRVLDACAAPGGKTAHILERADVALTAVEADDNRTRSLNENLRRLRLDALPGLEPAVRTADVRALDTWWDGRPFDRILADVPCTASGVARRHPDIKWLRREADIARFALAQAEIIDAVWQTLAGDGKMLYATCSVFTEENAGQVGAFLARHGDARLLHDWPILPTPDHDGFYYALLAKV